MQNYNEMTFISLELEGLANFPFTCYFAGLLRNLQKGTSGGAAMVDQEI